MPPIRRGPWTGRLRDLALAAAAALVTLAAVETLLRFEAHRLLPRGEWLSTASIFTPREGVGVGLIPGSTRLLVTGGAYTARDRINALGLRGPLPASGESRSRKRILILGDSFVFGQGVAERSALPARLEERLGGVEAINAGIPGYTFGQEYVFYRDSLRELRPDMLLVGFFMNDLDESRALDLERDALGVPVSYSLRDDAPLRKEERSRPGPAGRISAWLRGRSLLYALARSRLDSLRHRASDPGAEGGEREAADEERPAPPTYMKVFRADAVDETLPRWEMAWSTLDALAALAAGDGARLAVFYIPADWQLTDDAMGRWARYYGVDPALVDRRLPQKMLERWAALSGVPFFDLLPAFEARSRENLYFSDDLHWNESGHALAAERLASSLAEARLL